MSGSLKPALTEADPKGSSLDGVTVLSADHGAGLGELDEVSSGKEASALVASSRHRRLLLLRAIAALLFAFAIFFWPKLTLTGLVILWGIYSLFDGVLTLAAAFAGGSGTLRLWRGLIGLAGLACAGGALFAPDEVSGHLVGIIVVWASLTGAMQVRIGLELRKAVDGHWILVFDGLGALLFGLSLALWPSQQTEALPWLIGWFAAALGALLVSVAYWLGRPAT